MAPAVAMVYGWQPAGEICLNAAIKSLKKFKYEVCHDEALAVGLQLQVSSCRMHRKCITLLFSYKLIYRLV